jgi:hypothetical protein
MSGKTKTWAERLHDGKAHAVKPAPIDIAGMKVGQIMLVPTALMVDAFIRTLPKGRSLSARQLREAMAAAHGAEVTCPITTGFHLRTVAEAAWSLGRWRADSQPDTGVARLTAGFVDAEEAVVRHCVHPAPA